MTRPDQRLVTFEVDPAKITIARSLLKNDPRIHFVHGTIVLASEFLPLEPGTTGGQFHGGEYSANAAAPYRFDAVPDEIDLLVLDGGNWCSEVEFNKLIDRTKVVALDDSNREKSSKNWRNREFLLRHPETWEVIADDMEDRNGWIVARRR